jgi:bifunctional non-homologous end joining protein LigD
MTAEYRRAHRPRARVLVDYNQNAWGRTLASVYSPRPRSLPCVSTPVTWDELARGLRIEDFRIENVPPRLREVGDLWAPLLAPRGRFDLARLVDTLVSRRSGASRGRRTRSTHRAVDRPGDEPVG